MELQEKVNILKRLGIYDKFIYYLCLKRCKSKGECLSFLNDLTIASAMGLGFIWADTSEGYNFWSEIHSLIYDKFDKKYGVTTED